MSTETQILLFGSLRRPGREAGQSLAPLELEAPSPLSEVLRFLRISPDEVQLAMVNHRAVPRDHVVQPGDRISLFPREYAVFADWKDFRREGAERGEQGE